MKKSFLLLFSLQFMAFLSFAQVTVTSPLCENLINPIGIDILQPLFSWQLNSDSRSVIQTAYEIRVGTNAAALLKGKNLQWSSGKIVSDHSVHVPYTGAVLQSAKKYYWQVRVWDNSGKPSAWSETAFWQMGLLTAADWKAKWIQPGYAEDSVMRPSPVFRKLFKADKKIQSATAFITAHGLYEAFINGKRIGDAYLTPGWTSYKNRLQYQVYDVTTLLQTGLNTAGVVLGSGWFRGNLAWGGNKNSYGHDLALLFQMQITYTDGTSELITSDENWKSSTGAIRSSEIYHGETNDAREEKTGWTTTQYNDAGWSGVTPLDFDKSILTAT
ncbi:MAG TPA: alpha-L-rhamnosidase N-terminal domain-containing protein, partial [Panacibacter sp.]|nr:alpha-L-rhamnosidase N-terminal domain-containing protein [Panacibacter sp.]